jgi:hypothetical protein
VEAVLALVVAASHVSLLRGARSDPELQPFEGDLARPLYTNGRRQGQADDAGNRAIRAHRGNSDENWRQPLGTALGLDSFPVRRICRATRRAAVAGSVRWQEMAGRRRSGG